MLQAGFIVVGFFILVWQYFIIFDWIHSCGFLYFGLAIFYNFGFDWGDGTDYCQRDAVVFVLQEYKLGA
jgi:hypothetical protein